MPRSGETNQRIRDEQRGKVLQVAADVFARKGLAATKMTDIAAAAGMSYGLAYHYFRTKEQLFAEVVEQAVRGTIGLYQQAEAQPGTPWEQLTWLLSQILLGLEHFPAFGKVVLQVYTSDAVPSALRDVVRQERQVTRKIVQRLLAAGQADGQVAAGDPAHLATTLLACMQGLAFESLFAEGEVMTTLPSVEEILRLVKAPETAV